MAGSAETGSAAGAIRTGRLVDAAQLRTVARRVDKLRQAGHAALVLDGLAPAGRGSADPGPAAMQAFRDELLPRASLTLCTLREAQQWFGDSVLGDTAGDIACVPAMARRLRAAGASSVCIVGAHRIDGRALEWLDSEHAQGWLASARLAHGPRHGRRGLFARHLAAALARGFVVADAAVLAKMTSEAGSRVAESEADRALPAAKFVHDPSALPLLSWGEQTQFAQVPSLSRRRLDLYAIVDSADRVLQVLAAGVKTVQLRIKTPELAGPDWHRRLRSEVQRSVAASAAADAELFINDHWQLAHELGAPGVHLGQEDLLALGDSGRAALQASGLALGISTHSLWELCRARTLAPRYIACGPVWPTLTKAMPWRAQGLDNLAWWCRMAQTPVVAIGGVMGAERVRDAARCGADGVCVVRGLGDSPESVVPALQWALHAGRSGAEILDGWAWPHPSLRYERDDATGPHPANHRG